MTPSNDDFGAAIRQELNCFDGTDLITTIPAKSGCFRFVDVESDQYDLTFPSRSPGRWSTGQESVKYCSENFDVCLAEKGHVPGSEVGRGVFEVCETKKELKAFDVGQLRPELQIELFESTGPEKHKKAHILLHEIEANKAFSSVDCILAPSASGNALQIGGRCLAVRNPEDNLQVIATGVYDDWMNGTFKPV